jgi:hypothetical protein
MMMRLVIGWITLVPGAVPLHLSCFVQPAVDSYDAINQVNSTQPGVTTRGQVPKRAG